MWGEQAMSRGFRHLSMLLMAVGAMALSPVRAATPEAAAAAAQAWGQAVVARDVEAQMKLLPATMFSSPGDRERNRLRRLHDKELAIINRQNYLSFDVRAPSQTLKVNKTTVVVLPYRSILAIAEGKLQTDSVLIALSEEGSDQWSVFDGSGHGARSLKMLIPGYTTGLSVPPAASKIIKE
jgi:hypothetical protein